LTQCREPHDGPKAISGGKARGGEIILNTPLRRAIFLDGLIVAAVLVIVLIMVR